MLVGAGGRGKQRNPKSRTAVQLLNSRHSKVQRDHPVEKYVYIQYTSEEILERGPGELEASDLTELPRGQPWRCDEESAKQGERE